jgi:hypothetical protein
MRNRDYMLLAGALAAALKGIDAKLYNPMAANLLVCAGLGLAWFAQRPRRQNGRHHTPALTPEELTRLEDEGNPHHE